MYEDAVSAGDAVLWLVLSLHFILGLVGMFVIGTVFLVLSVFGFGLLTWDLFFLFSCCFYVD
jgi:hypothetical protein